MKLLKEAKIGNKSLKNSMAMAPMTRDRAKMYGGQDQGYIDYPTLD